MDKITENLKSKLYDKYIQVYQSMNATTVYNFYLKARKVDMESGGVEIIDLTNKWNKYSKPINAILKIIK